MGEDKHINKQNAPVIRVKGAAGDSECDEAVPETKRNGVGAPGGGSCAREALLSCTLVGRTAAAALSSGPCAGPERKAEAPAAFQAALATSSALSYQR